MESDFETHAAIADSVELTDQQWRELQTQSEPFLGQWTRLISTTNWEKGAIIVDWQAALQAAGLPRSSWSDSQWSHLVGGASPQHVGRLRKTFQRFGHVHKEYGGLYWSHFYAALDWDDAEMWLEGSLQNSWSVSRMRTMRWETMGMRPEDEPRVEQIVVSEPDEETHSLLDPVPASQRDRDYAEGPRPEGPDFGDADRGSAAPTGKFADDSVQSGIEPSASKIKPFEAFTELPDDVQSAANAFKIAIIRHKVDGWKDISLTDLNSLLDALKALAVSASE